MIEGTVTICNELGEFANCKKYSSKKERNRIIQEFILKYRLKDKGYILKILPYDKKMKVSGSIVIKAKEKTLVDSFYNNEEERETLIKQHTKNISNYTIEIIPDYEN
jgi:hypothetical protein